MNVKSVLDELVVAGRKSFLLNNEMIELGYGNTPYTDIYGSIADAVYTILGEECDYENSITYAFFSDQSTTDAQCANGLYAAYLERSKNAVLSDATMDALCCEAKIRGMPVQNMIKFILAEWVMRQQIARDLAKAI